MSFYKDIHQSVTQSTDSFYAPSRDAILAHVAQIHEHWLEHTRNGRATDPITASNLTLATVLLEVAATDDAAPQEVSVNGKVYKLQ